MPCCRNCRNWSKICFMAEPPWPRPVKVSRTRKVSRTTWQATNAPAAHWANVIERETHSFGSETRPIVSRFRAQYSRTFDYGSGAKFLNGAQSLFAIESFVCDRRSPLWPWRAHARPPVGAAGTLRPPVTEHLVLRSRRPLLPLHRTTLDPWRSRACWPSAWIRVTAGTRSAGRRHHLGWFYASTGALPSLFKIDVEGNDVAVLRGAQGLLSRPDRPWCRKAYVAGSTQHLRGQTFPFGGRIQDIEQIDWTCNLFAVPLTEHSARRWTSVLQRAA